MNIYAIYATASDEEPIVRTLADGPAEALELVRGNAWCFQQMTETAWAERVEEL